MFHRNRKKLGHIIKNTIKLCNQPMLWSEDFERDKEITELNIFNNFRI